VIEGNEEYYEVQWKRYNETTLEPRDALLEDVPKMVNKFEKKNKIVLYDSKNKKKNKIAQNAKIVINMLLNILYILREKSETVVSKFG